jgi:acyl-CoA synthetase (NDP forming)
MDTKYLIKDVIKTARAGTGLPEYEVKELLRKINFPVPNGRFFPAGDTIPQRLKLAYPLVAKVSLESTGSKTELHGVRTGLQNEGELRSAVKDILKIEGAEGVLVEEMAPAGVEVIVGGVYDNQFGPVMMFGVGGIFTELFGDVSFSLAPLSEEDVHWMISEIKGRRLLEDTGGVLLWTRKRSFRFSQTYPELWQPVS